MELINSGSLRKWPLKQFDVIIFIVIIIVIIVVIIIIVIIVIISTIGNCTLLVSVVCVKSKCINRNILYTPTFRLCSFYCLTLLQTFHFNAFFRTYKPLNFKMFVRTVFTYELKQV